VSVSWTAHSKELPAGWHIATSRPHPLIEAVSWPTTTSIHVVVARTWNELIWRVRAADARQRENARREESSG
jgi:hypothetical protein